MLEGPEVLRAEDPALRTVIVGCRSSYLGYLVWFGKREGKTEH